MHPSLLEELHYSFNVDPSLTLIVIIKGRHPFTTNLQGLDLKNPDRKCRSLLLMNSFFAAQTPETFCNLFHYVVYFEGSTFWHGDSMARLDKLYFKDIDFMIGRLVMTLSANRIRLVSMEESFVRFSSLLRVKYHIPGPKSDETEGMTSKIRMKTIARTQVFHEQNEICLTLGEWKIEERKIRERKI